MQKLEGVSVILIGREIPLRRGVARAIGGSLLLLALASCGVLGGADEDWPGYGGSPDENYYSPLDQINADKIDRLKPVFAVDHERERAVSAPIAERQRIVRKPFYDVLDEQYAVRSGEEK